MLESRDNAWEGDEDVPFHRTSGRACWSMINRDNIRDRYRISIEVSALVRFSSMLRPTDRTRKNQSFSKIRTWIIPWSFLIEPRKIRMEFSFSKIEIKLTYHRFVLTIREKIFRDARKIWKIWLQFAKAISNLWNEILENENKKKIIILQSSFYNRFLLRRTFKTWWKVTRNFYYICIALGTKLVGTGENFPASQSMKNSIIPVHRGDIGFSDRGPIRIYSSDVPLIGTIIIQL